MGGPSWEKGRTGPYLARTPEDTSHAKAAPQFKRNKKRENPTVKRTSGAIKSRVKALAREEEEDVTRPGWGKKRERILLRSFSRGLQSQKKKKDLRNERGGKVRKGGENSLSMFLLKKKQGKHGPRTKNPL